jgi:hypothetical protein
MSGGGGVTGGMDAASLRTSSIKSSATPPSSYAAPDPTLSFGMGLVGRKVI